MGANEPVDLMLQTVSGGWLEHAPSPMVTVEGATHLVRDANLAFCRLVDGPRADILGKPLCSLLPDNPECLLLLDDVYRTGKPGILQGREHADPGPIFSSYVMWPVQGEDRTCGVVVQITETAPLHARAIAMNEALLLGSLRQHELIAAADEANVRLQEEIVHRAQSERDAMMLTNEISHRIKNNLQIVSSLIGNEITKTPAQFVKGYVEMEVRISAIAKLYDLISQSRDGDSVPLDSYLKELAKTMSASLLEPSSAIAIEVSTIAVTLDPNRAVAFGLLVNELGTNAIKHAFPNGVGVLRLSIQPAGDQIELIVADDGVGISKDAASVPGRHGSDYVEIFVRQLGGHMTVSSPDQLGTVIRILFPLLPVP
jgi:two-component sensor histidine kinase